jgi:head-tail adaptor
MYPALNNTDKETEAIVVWTVGNQPDVRARSGQERLHHGAEVAEI